MATEKQLAAMAKARASRVNVGKKKGTPDKINRPIGEMMARVAEDFFTVPHGNYANYVEFLKTEHVDQYVGLVKHCLPKADPSSGGDNIQNNFSLKIEFVEATPKKIEMPVIEIEDVDAL